MPAFHPSLALAPFSEGCSFTESHLRRFRIVINSPLEGHPSRLDWPEIPGANHLSSRWSSECASANFDLNLSVGSFLSHLFNPRISDWPPSRSSHSAARSQIPPALRLRDPTYHIFDRDLTASLSLSLLLVTCSLHLKAEARIGKEQNSGSQRPPSSAPTFEGGVRTSRL